LYKLDQLQNERSKITSWEESGRIFSGGIYKFSDLRQVHKCCLNNIFATFTREVENNLSSEVISIFENIHEFA